MKSVYPDQEAAEIAEDTVHKILGRDYMGKGNMSEYSTELVGDKAESIYNGLDQLSVENVEDGRDVSVEDIIGEADLFNRLDWIYVVGSENMNVCNNWESLPKSGEVYGMTLRGYCSIEDSSFLSEARESYIVSPRSDLESEKMEKNGCSEEWEAELKIPGYFQILYKDNKNVDMAFISSL